MGEKRDSGSKDADNFGAEFGTDKRLKQRQAATRRNQAVQRNRRERKSRVDDRAMTNVPVVTSPNNISNRDVAVLQAASGGGGGGGGGVLNVDTRTANEIAAANAVARALQSGRPSDTGPGAVINQTLAELAGASSGVIFGDEFGGNLRPRLTTLNVSPTLASTQQVMNQDSVPELERLLLARQNANRSVNIAGPTPGPINFENELSAYRQQVQNLINSPPSPLDATNNEVKIFDEDDPAGDRFLNSSLSLPPNPLTYETKIFDENDPTGDLFLNPSLGRPVGNIGTVPTTTDIVNASIEQARANQGSGIASLPSVSPTSRPTRAPSDTDLFNFGSEFGMFTDPLVASSVMLDTRNALNQGNNETTEDLGFEDVDDDDSFFPVTNQPQDITALNPNFLSRLPLVGDALYEGQINQLQQFASIPGSQYDYSTGSGTAQAGQGTLNLSPSGIVTYSGPRDGSYTGPFANLVNPPQRPDKDVTDPCPPGFQLIGGVCRPTYDVTAPAAPPAPTPGSNFQMTPTAGFPTSFAPMTQATPVSLPDPFVLSPTGAAIGRRV